MERESENPPESGGGGKDVLMLVGVALVSIGVAWLLSLLF